MIIQTHISGLVLFGLICNTQAWVNRGTTRAFNTALFESTTSSTGSLHGQNACFLPLRQLEQDYFAPRIIQIAGAYPGLTKEEVMGVTSEPPPDQGQWSYDFSDPEGPQLGTVAIDGSAIVHNCRDPIVVIAEHQSIGVTLPEAIKDAVDLIVLIDRANTDFAERKFMAVDIPQKGVQIVGFASKKEMPEGAEILGRVEVVQIPWLPAMAPTKSGFMEVDGF